MSPPPSPGNESWLPTNQPRDFTCITPFVDIDLATKRVQDTELPSGAEPTKQEKAPGWTFQHSIAADAARVQACPCYGGKALSATVRTKEYEFGSFGLLPSPLEDPDKYHLYSGYQQKPTQSPLFLVSKYEVARAVVDAIRLVKEPKDSGLLIISGSTNSMKTNLAMGLMHMLLEHLMREWLRQPGKKRKPHLVTCEDTFEQHFVELHRLRRLEHCYGPKPGLPFRPNYWLGRVDMPDYTPRLRATDTTSLNDAVDDALRMTPSIFYAGEIRQPADWTALRRLAQSHLVVATTHASSLTNTFGILRRNLKVASPAQRSELAVSLCAVVHMRADKLPDDGGVGFVLPSCWVRTPAAVAAFTSDGMASIIPKYCDLAKDPFGGGGFCLGRRSFTSAFLGFHKKRPAAPRFFWDAEPERERLGVWTDRGAALTTFLSNELAIEKKKATAGEPPKLSSGRYLTEIATAWDLRGE
jgi:hypothetical protein